MIEQNMDTHQRSTEQRVSTFFPVELEKSEVLAVVDAIIARVILYSGDRQRNSRIARGNRTPWRDEFGSCAACPLNSLSGRAHRGWLFALSDRVPKQRNGAR
jgi:hypothetical protein